MPQTIDVSIIIVGYQSRDDLPRCLTSVLEQEYEGAFEVIFVENPPSDGSAALMRAEFPEVTVIQAPCNGGYAGGCNLGAEHARGETLVFLNPDTEVACGWLKHLVEPLIVDRSIGMTTSKILLMDNPERINACGNEIWIGGLTWCRGVNQPADTFVEDANVTAVSGCSFAIHSESFHAHGGFDASFFMYLEDTDLSWRVRRSGFRCRFVAKSVVFHRYRFALSPDKFRHVERNRYRMLIRNNTVPTLVSLLPVLLLGEALMWAYALGKGPAYVVAKTRAYKWSSIQMPPSGPSFRKVPDRALLREHTPYLLIASVIGNRPSVLQAALDVCSLIGAKLAFLGMLLTGRTPASNVAPREEW